ncbi:flagellin [Butyrivibrio sp.]|uniref:flagellin n=1 Tax=Butyrivibrio sp. TaxID=28121 RepID=UPI0025C05491|nr:flagellin [Butyrivibrio sp.]
MVIQHNMTALNSNRQLGIMHNNKARSSEKLTSGYKINRAADDAAGLAISEKMRRQIRGLTQASENVQDGISYVQVADSALAEIDLMLARMTQLCVQAATDTLTVDDRNAIDKEIQQIKMECNRIFHVTSFNDRPIWDENNMSPIVIGTERRPIFTSSVNGVGQITEKNRAAWPNDNNFHFETTSDGVKIKWKGFDGTEYESKEIKWPSENELRQGFTVKVDETSMDYSVYPDASNINPSYTFKLDRDATLDMLINNLNEKSAYVSSSYSVRGTVKGDTGSSSVSGTWQYLSGLLYRNNALGAEDNMVPENGGNNRQQTNVADKLSFSFTFGKNDNTRPNPPDSFSAEVKSTGSVSANSYSKDERIRGIWWNYNTNSSLTHLISQSSTDSNNLENAVRTAFGPHENPYTHEKYDLTAFGGNISITLETSSLETLTYGTNGSQIPNGNNGIGTLTLSMSVKVGETADDIIKRIKGITGIDLTQTTNNGLSRGNVPVTYFDGNIYGGTMMLKIQAGSESTPDDVIPLIYDVLSTYSLGIDNLNTLNTSGAKNGIEQIKRAGQIVDEQRSVFGAYQNQMEHAYKNLKNTVENTTSSESLIRDTDMSAELVKFSNSMILAHAGDAILAQANQTNQGVLSLLQ